MQQIIFYYWKNSKIPQVPSSEFIWPGRSACPPVSLRNCRTGTRWVSSQARDDTGKFLKGAPAFDWNIFMTINWLKAKGKVCRQFYQYSINIRLGYILFFFLNINNELTLSQADYQRLTFSIFFLFVIVECAASTIFSKHPLVLTVNPRHLMDN